MQNQPTVLNRNSTLRKLFANAGIFTPLADAYEMQEIERLLATKAAEARAEFRATLHDAHVLDYEDFRIEQDFNERYQF